MTEARTQRPTRRRLRRAREEGLAARSRVLESAVVLSAATGVLAWAGADLVAALGRLGREAFGGLPAMPPSEALVGRLSDSMAGAAGAVLPLLLALLAAAVVASLVEVRPLLTLRPLRPDAGRLGPARGMGRLLNRRGLLEGGRALLLVVSIGLVTAIVLLRHGRHLGAMPALELGSSLGAALSVAMESVRWWLIGLMAVGIVDLLVERRLTHGRLMMTRSEVERERREAEGDPIYRAERRKLHRQAAELDLAAAVQRATAIVFDGRERAAALEYRADLPAPRLLAKGRGHVAWRLVELAREGEVPIAREAALARDLQEVEPGAFVPVNLYEAVAVAIKQLLDRLEALRASRLAAQLGLSEDRRALS